MTDIPKASVLQTWLLLIGIFFLGVLAGAMGTVATDFAGQKTRAVFPVARWLDMDFLHLKSGKMIAGRILSRDKDGFVLEVSDGTLKFRPDEIERIDENYYTRYFKKAW